MHTLHPMVSKAHNGFRPKVALRIGGRMKGSKIGRDVFSTHGAAHTFAVIAAQRVARRLGAGYLVKL